jgi:hypothetical protein
METAFHDKPGLIGLVPVSGELGKLIHMAQWLNSHPRRQWLAPERYPRLEHAFTCLGDGTLIEAEMTGARIRPVSEYKLADIYWCHGIYSTLESGQGEKVATAARRFEGTPYSFTDYTALLLRRLRIPAPKLRTYIASTHHLICSQLCDTAHALAGRTLFDGRWPGYVTPYDLYALDRSITHPGSVSILGLAVPDRAVPDQRVLERRVLEQRVLDEGVLDQAVLDPGVLDQNVPDQDVPDQGVPDQGVPAGDPV